MHLVLRPVRLPLLPLDLGPARGVEVSLVALLAHASSLLSPLLLRELRRGGGCSCAADAPCPHCFLGCLSPLITVRSATWWVGRVFGGPLPFAILSCFPIFGLRNKEGSWSPLSVGQLLWPVSAISLSLCFPLAVKQSRASLPGLVSVAVLPRAVAV